MKVSIFINKVEHKRDIPISWDEVTFKDFLALESCGQDAVKVLSLFTRTDYEEIKKAKIPGLEQAIAQLAFLKTEPIPHVPKEILGYPIPKNLEFEQVQMYIDLKNYVSEAQKKTPMEQLEAYTLYCAVYACRHWKGSYSWEYAEAMKDVFLQAPCAEVMGIGNFTLLKLAGLNLNINLASLKVGTRTKRFRLALKGFLIRLASPLHWIIWWKKLGVKKKSY